MNTVGIVIGSVLAAMLCAAGNGVSAQTVEFRPGETSPPFAITPAKATTCGFVAFQAPLDGRTITNACSATWVDVGYGGQPTLLFDQDGRTIDLAFIGDPYEVCGADWTPVNGVRGDFGRLAPGKWTFSYDAAQYSFDVAPCGLTNITLLPASKGDMIDPKGGAKMFDPDGLGFAAYWEANVSLSAFKLKAVIGNESVQVAFPGPSPALMLEQQAWLIVDPVGCMDDDPATECHPTSIARYLGGTEDVPVTVRPIKGEGERKYLAKVQLDVKVTVIDGKIAAIDGLLQIGNGYGTGTYPVPLVGRVQK